MVADGTVSANLLEDRKIISPFHPWVFKLRDVKCYLSNPIILGSGLRSNLDAFKGKDPGHVLELVYQT